MGDLTRTPVSRELLFPTLFVSIFTTVDFNNHESGYPPVMNNNLWCKLCQDIFSQYCCEGQGTVHCEGQGTVHCPICFLTKPAAKRYSGVGGIRMPRTQRKKSESGIYRVMLRGINQQQIFEDEEDCAHFLAILRVCKKISGFDLFAYCLMGNPATRGKRAA